MSTWQLALVAVAALAGSLALVARQRGRVLPAGTPDAFSDPARLTALAAIGGPATLPTGALDHVAHSLAGQLRAPSVLISVFDADHQHVAGQFGGTWGDAEVTHGPLDRAETLCWLVVAADRSVEIPDVRRRPELRSTRPVDAGVRAYLGMPMRARSGEAVGVIGVYDRAPRRWNADDHHAMARTAQLAMREIERAIATESGDVAAAPVRDDGDSSAVGQ